MLLLLGFGSWLGINGKKGFLFLFIDSFRFFSLITLLLLLDFGSWLLGPWRRW
jgi:hypothetical protein